MEVLSIMRRLRAIGHTRTYYTTQWTSLLLFLLIVQSLGLTIHRQSKDVMVQLRRAMDLSNASTNNISAAQEACHCWSTLLEDDDDEASTVLIKQDSTIMRLSLALYGSCLVRSGQDYRAVSILDQALNLDPHNQQELRLSKAQALQRILKYAEALEEYQLLESSAGSIGAATCQLRLGNLSGALNLLEQNDSGNYENDEEPSGRGLLGVLQYMQPEKTNSDLGVHLIRNAAATDPLYCWINKVLSPSTESNDVVRSSSNVFLSLLQINLCPLDDPTLILLDDKIYLHRLMSKYLSRTRHFWPPGIVLPCKDDRVNARVHFDVQQSSLYMLKDRSGYGSHGNKILQGEEATNLVTDQNFLSPYRDELLLQKMVDPPMLLQGCKFSLRIYVIYFSPTEAQISLHGLVKLASLEMDQTMSSVDPSRHMTNSGRDVSMEQHDLDYLQKTFEDMGHSYELFWAKICSAVKEVIGCYQQERKQLSWDAQRLALGMPKILGFDFVVDAKSDPWLVEVNRFPGLEPRDESDRKVKYQVVHDAWVSAGNRQGLDVHPLENLLKAVQTDEKDFALQCLNLKRPNN